GGYSEERRQLSGFACPQGAYEQSEHRGREHGVQRQQQIGLLSADRDGNVKRRSGKECDRYDGRIADERSRTSADDEQPADQGREVERWADEQLEVGAGDQRGRQAALGEGGQSEAG